MDRPARGHELAGQAQQGLVRAAPLGHGLDAQDGEGPVASRGPGAGH